jgi:hypothetical protein
MLETLRNLAASIDARLPSNVIDLTTAERADDRIAL